VDEDLYLYKAFYKRERYEKHVQVVVFAFAKLLHPVRLWRDVHYTEIGEATSSFLDVSKLG
jgi:hypothetical protein